MSADAMPRTPLAALRARADEDPEAIALVDFDERLWTREALRREADALAAGLRARGFQAGDRVLFSVRPGARSVALALAVHALGGVLVPQDPGTGDALFRTRLARIAPRWVMAESPLLLRPRGWLGALARAGGLRWAPYASVASATFVRVGRWLPGSAPSLAYEALRRAGTGVALPPAPSLAPDAEALIVQTSGSTTAPRAVVHSRRSLEAILRAITAELALAPHDVLYARDLHLLLPALAAGATAVVPAAGAFDPATLLRRVRRYGVTHAFLVTRDCRLLLEHLLPLADRVPGSLRMLMIGAAPVHAEFLERLRPVLPPRCVAWCAYGSTEVLPIARVSLEEKVAWRGRGDLVGAPIAGVEVRIRDDGQLVVRGERVCRGYLDEPAVEEIATGDLATLDDGRIVLLGRAKDMLIRGEHNIYPELYEPVVERIPGVRRAALVGDFVAELADEQVVLVVEPDPGQATPALERRIAAALRAGPTRIDGFALPDRILFATLPEGGRSGKVDKAALRRTLGLRSPLRSPLRDGA